jgi:hypothetical protein
MKSIRMFVLAALAACMAIAVAGAGSAMAENTQLCRQDMAAFNQNNEYASTLACPASEVVNTVHALSVGKVRLLGEREVILGECNVLFQSTSVGGLGAPQIIEGHFTYSNCGTCSVAEIGGLAIIEVLRQGHERARVTGEAEISVNCAGVTCVFNGEGLLGIAKGPLLSNAARPNGEVYIESQVLNEVEGAFCPALAALDILITPLTATYLAK